MATKQPWTKERLIQAGQLYHQMYGIVPSQACFYPTQATKQAANAARRADDAERKAEQALRDGDSERAKRYREVERQEREMAAEYESYADRYVTDGYWPAAATIIKRFNHFDDFLIACGFEVGTRSVTSKLNKFEEALKTHNLSKTTEPTT